jgi:hypothetical protein
VFHSVLIRRSHDDDGGGGGGGGDNRVNITSAVGGRSETTLQGSREGREGEVTGFAFLAAAAKSQKEH